jgi:Zn finger protein HypA/HybF involved in hydrogenase expression
MRKSKTKLYLRYCRRCEQAFRTPAKFGRICPNCHKGPWIKKKEKK